MNLDGTAEAVRQHRLRNARRKATNAIKALQEKLDDISRKLPQERSFSSEVRNMGAPLVDLAEAGAEIDLLEEQAGDAP